MKLNQNSFINYTHKHNTLFRISDIRNHRLICKITDFKSNLSFLDFGHYDKLKLTFKELQNYFKYNRLLRICKNKNYFLKNKLNCVFKEINPQGNPILKNCISNVVSGDFKSKVVSLLHLKKIFINKKVVNGRILKKVRSGFIVALLGFFAFLPNSQYFLRFRKKKKYANTKIFFNIIPLMILAIKYLHPKSKRFLKTKLKTKLSIIVSFSKGLNNFEKFNRKVTIKKLIRIKRIEKLKTFFFKKKVFN